MVPVPLVPVEVLGGLPLEDCEGAFVAETWPGGTLICGVELEVVGGGGGAAIVVRCDMDVATGPYKGENAMQAVATSIDARQASRWIPEQS